MEGLDLDIQSSDKSHEREKISSVRAGRPGTRDQGTDQGSNPAIVAMTVTFRVIMVRRQQTNGQFCQTNGGSD